MALARGATQPLSFSSRTHFLALRRSVAVAAVALAVWAAAVSSSFPPGSEAAPAPTKAQEPPPRGAIAAVARPSRAVFVD